MSNLIEHLYLKALVASPRWRHIVDSDLRRAVELFWRYKMPTPLNLDHPVTLNEKIQWLKLHGPADLWSMLSDKVRMKEMLAEQGLEQYLPQTYGSWNRSADIDLETLPDSFVLKCTHDCGSAIVVKDKRQLTDKELRRLDRALRRPFGYRTVEPHYLRIPRLIMAEELIGTPEYFASHLSLTDYKFWCFDGHAEVCLVCTNRHISHRKAVKELYSVRPWKPLPEGLAHPPTPWVDLEQPANWDEMVALAERLSVGHPQVRVDLYNVDGRIYIGELTFTASSGIMRSLSDDMQRRLGGMVKLP